MRTSLTLTGEQHQQLMRHLFPDDGCEAVAIALCGRSSGLDRNRLLVHQIVPVPYEACSVRLPDQVTWPTEILLPLLDEATRKGMALVKIHGHRGYDRFSKVDDASDNALFPSIYAWLNDGQLHASVIVLDSGRMFGRIVDDQGRFKPLSAINVVGDDLKFWYASERLAQLPSYAKRIAQAFGEGTFSRLRKLRIAVVGCSGTGSPVIEQLARNCVGTLVLVDPDVVETKNLNRILNTTMQDAIEGRHKVDVAKAAILKMGLDTQVETYAKNLFDPDVVMAVASCDVIFGCMDTIDGRHLLNKLATFYLLPYFDLGVRLEANGEGGVDQVCGSVHYLKPGGSSLLSRGVYNLEQVRAAGLYRSDPAVYRALLKEGYIRGIREDRPAVIQLNTLIASLAVNEFLARLHPYRIDPNGEFAIHRISLSHGIYEHETDGQPCSTLLRHVGRGDVTPLLDWAELSATCTAA